jgi:membrane protease YdiL (CAAX protease family)
LAPQQETIGFLDAHVNWIDWVIAVGLIVAAPIEAIYARRGLQRSVASGRPDARAPHYVRAVAMQWTLTLIVLGYWIGWSRPLAALGLVWPSGSAVWWTALIVVLVAALYALQVTSVRRSAEARAKVREQLESRPSVRMILPATPREFRAFVAVAVTAGLCEEVLFRGFLFWFFSALLPYPAAILAAIAVFGIGHAYLGMRDVLLTATVGAIALGLYLLTGSLVASIAVHMTLDLANGLIGYTAFGDEQPGVDTVSREPV